MPNSFAGVHKLYTLPPLPLSRAVEDAPQLDGYYCTYVREALRGRHEVNQKLTSCASHYQKHGCS